MSVLMCTACALWVDPDDGIYVGDDFYCQDHGLELELEEEIKGEASDEQHCPSH